MLNLGSCGLIRIPKIDFLGNTLKGLFLNRNTIEKIENLEELTELQKLNLQFNKISKIENLEKNTNLRSLNLSGNNISKIEKIGNLLKMEELSIYRNEIKELKGVESLWGLKRLHLQYNKISDSPTHIRSIFSKIKNLKYVNLAGNPLQGSSLKPLANFCEYHDIWLAGI